MKKNKEQKILLTKTSIDNNRGVVPAERHDV